ncbi:Sugar transporter ERD6-like [Actinidia chinensis var. chinensis]|uniref:Sugar transporter ERD6-like n=1 Tax=Actinidia chinensis var. chinensis TaxID=1590841 RepID=A0A2R6RV86_ACTCC|nr:Sugar transporter ERD6-like [Actinidia chinensis var. chinensis]
MAIEQCKNIENCDNNGLEDLENPFIEIKKVVDSEDDESGISGENGSIGMVLLSTAVSICDSFEFGSRVGYSAPTQSTIREDLHLSLAEGTLLLDVGRLLTGYGIGILSYVVSVFITKIAPTNLRGGLNQSRG